MLSTAETTNSFINNTLVIANIAEVVFYVVKDISYNDCDGAMDNTGLTANIVKNTVVSRLNQKLGNV